MTNKLLSVLFLASFLVGCGSFIDIRATNQTTKYYNLLDTNYVLGEKMSTFVGGSMIRVQDYYVTETTRYTPRKWIANKEFEATSRGAVVVSSSGGNDLFRERGMVTYQGLEYTALTHSAFSSNSYSFLIDSNGKPVGVVWPTNTNITSFSNANFADDLFFTVAVESKAEIDRAIDEKKGIINYEIIYNGVSSNSINLTYREFSPNNLARSAFFQNLTYPVGSETIRFRDLRIQVHNADSERIEFTVLED